jgi:hypothetical protein
MSSLQKFHRRTLVAGGAVVALFPTVGSGSDTIGYRLGYASGSSAYLIAAPKSTEVSAISWGSSGTTRGTTSTTNGALNTGTLYGFGSAAHRAAYYCKSLTTGGYNSWYLPAKDELLTLGSNKNATPFATDNTFLGKYYWSSTEDTANAGAAWGMERAGNAMYLYGKGSASGNYYTRAVRQYYAPAAIGDGSATTGFWLGTSGDGVSKLIVAPKSTEVTRAWGTQTIIRGVTSTINGVANTTTLFGFGSAAHPAAYYCRALTTGGYNTWYLPAKDELNTLYVNRTATPFATADSFFASIHWSSTEPSDGRVWFQNMSDGTQAMLNSAAGASYDGFYTRATRRSTV